MNCQITNTVLMIRPVQFRMNEQTAVNNYYQKVLDNTSTQNINSLAVKEFDAFVKKSPMGLVAAKLMKSNMSRLKIWKTNLPVIEIFTHLGLSWNGKQFNLSTWKGF